MSISVACPRCGRSVKLANDRAGKKIRCKECQAVFRVPAEDEDDREADRPRSRPGSSRGAGGRGAALWLVGGGVLLLLLLGGGIVGGILLSRNRVKESPGKETPVAVVPQPPTPVAVVPQLPTPVADWSSQEAEGTPVVGARGLQVFVKGKLVRVVPLAQPIREKSIEAWITISNLDQQHTMLVGINDRVGTWDGIVYADAGPRQWYLGSSFRHRSGDLRGAAVEAAGPTDLVHLVIVYETYGRITLYRNGILHGGRTPRGPEAALRTYPAEDCQFWIGADSLGNYAFQGEVKSARLYNQALPPHDVTRLFEDGKGRSTGTSGPTNPPGTEPVTNKEATSAVYKTPQECFQAFATAETTGDHKTYVACLAPESQRKMAGEWALTAAVFAGSRPKDNDAKEMAKRAKPLLDAAARHGLTEDVTRGITDSKDPKERQKVEQALLARIKDPAAFLVDILAAFDKVLGGGGKKEYTKQLIEVKIDGDRAAGTVLIKYRFSEEKKSVSLVKIDGSWRVLNDKEEKKTDRTVKAPDFKTTAEAFATEFVKDEKAASNKYKDKIIELEGVVKEVKGNSVSLVGAKMGKKRNPDFPADPPPTVECLPSRKEDSAGLAAGQKVKVIGRFSVANDFFIGLTDCSIRKLE